MPAAFVLFLAALVTFLLDLFGVHSPHFSMTVLGFVFLSAAFLVSGGYTWYADRRRPPV